MIRVPTVAPVTLAISGHAERFPVARVFCVGRNYAAHAQEMGGTGREAPFFFMKPAQSLFEMAADGSSAWPYPVNTTDTHHEVELVVAVGDLPDGGSDLSVEQAGHAIWGVALGLDMTRRDRQAEMKATQRSWEIGKAFERAAPIGPLHVLDEIGGLPAGDQCLWLEINGERRQSGELGQMIYGMAEILSVLSQDWTLLPGDLVYTGTPSGVGPVVVGDQLTLGLTRPDGTDVMPRVQVVCESK